MTVSEIISLIQSKTLRTDKNLFIYRGLNWAKDQLCDSKLFFKIGTAIKLVKDQYEYSLPSDFSIECFLRVKYTGNGSWFYDLTPDKHGSSIFQPANTGYPNSYTITPEHLYIGYSTAGDYNIEVVPYYFQKFTDYSPTDSTTEAGFNTIISFCGPDILIYAGNYFVYDSIEDPEGIGQNELAKFRIELGKSVSKHISINGPFTTPNNMYNCFNPRRL